jgi:flagellar basal body-associated protein FliL
VTVAEAEAAAEAPEAAKKGGKKKLLVMVVLFCVIGYVAASKTVLKPPPLTEQQQADKEALADYELRTKCALANGLRPPDPPKLETVETPTTTAPADAPHMLGPVLQLEPTTLNLAGGHFLKVALALQLDHSALAGGHGGEIDDLKSSENWAAVASQAVLNTFSNEEMAKILPLKEREHLRHEIAYEVCTESEGNVTTVYFTEFVAQ